MNVRAWPVSVLRWLETHITHDKFIIAVAVVGAVGSLAASVFDKEFTDSPVRIFVAGLLSLGLLATLMTTAVSTSVVFCCVIVVSFWSDYSPVDWLIVLVCCCILLGYVDELKPWLDALPFLGLVLMLIDTAIHNGFNFSVYVLMGGIFIGAWLVGRFARKQQQLQQVMRIRQQLEIANMRLRQQQRNHWLARDIHDSVTNELSYIILLSTLDDAPLTVEKQHLIGRKAKETLNKVHEIIGILDCNGDASLGITESSPQSFRERMTGYCKKQDEDLRQAGYQGTSTVIGEGELNGVAKSVVWHLLTELYANIVRHCTPHVDTYSLVVRFTERDISVLQTNTCDKGVRYVNGIRSGKGLNLQQAAVQSLEGQMTMTYEDGTWLVSVRIPIV